MSRKVLPLPEELIRIVREERERSGCNSKTAKSAYSFSSPRQKKEGSRLERAAIESGEVRARLHLLGPREAAIKSCRQGNKSTVSTVPVTRLLTASWKRKKLSLRNEKVLHCAYAYATADMRQFSQMSCSFLCPSLPLRAVAGDNSIGIVGDGASVLLAGLFYSINLMIIHSCSDMPLLAYADADWALARIAVVPPLANWHSKGRAALVVPESLRLVFHPNMIGGSRRCSDPGPISLAGSHWIYSSFCAACCEASRFACCCALPIRKDFALLLSPRKMMILWKPHFPSTGLGFRMSQNRSIRAIPDDGSDIPFQNVSDREYRSQNVGGVVGWTYIPEAWLAVSISYWTSCLKLCFRVDDFFLIPRCEKKKGPFSKPFEVDRDKDKRLATELDTWNRTQGAVISDAAKKEERLAVKAILAFSLIRSRESDLSLAPLTS
ncbi:hypothetical protein V6N11_014162 [Hibiscus sabdariffa]|uniref:Uncharacterized protein n=1 Tax=Hibiscus sabdariffa TaxID=183260 RepID=A0ABR2AGW5_9ROSI